MKTNGTDAEEKRKTAERSPFISLKETLNSEYVKKRFEEVMGEKSTAFIASVLNAVQKSPELAKCDPQSILSSAMVAATMDLPIDSNLGFSAIVPYNTKRKAKDGKEYWVTLAQFQIMYKGFIQLALRSGQYKTINVSPIYADEFESYDIITGDINIHPVAGGYREQEDQEKIIGYVAFFRLLNGYERLEYWSMTKIIAHGQKYSKSFDNKNGLWKKDPHAMYAKTVLKNTLSKWGIMSVTMQRAMITDQAVIKSIDKPIDSDNVRYIDSTDPIKQDENAGEAETEHDAESGDRKDPNAPLAEEKTPEEPDNGKGKGFTNSPENRKTPVKPSTKDEANEGEGLFESEEVADLEEQYEREQMGPDWGSR